MTQALDELIFGPPPEGFIPTPMRRFYKGLPGEDSATVSGPGSLAYPASALVYATKRGIPIINDTANLPVPGIPGDPKNNARLLATILTFESITMVLPKVKALGPEEL